MKKLTTKQRQLVKEYAMRLFGKRLNESIKIDAFKYAKYYAANFSGYVSKKTAKYTGNAESWRLNFSLIIPKENSENASLKELETDIKDELNIGGVQGPGKTYAKLSNIDVISRSQYFYVYIEIRGGMDI